LSIFQINRISRNMVKGNAKAMQLKTNFALIRIRKNALISHFILALLMKFKIKKTKEYWD